MLFSNAVCVFQCTLYSGAYPVNYLLKKQNRVRVSQSSLIDCTRVELLGLISVILLFSNYCAPWSFPLELEEMEQSNGNQSRIKESSSTSRGVQSHTSFDLTFSEKETKSNQDCKLSVSKCKNHKIMLHCSLQYSPVFSVLGISAAQSFFVFFLILSCQVVRVLRFTLGTLS